MLYSASVMAIWVKWSNFSFGWPVLQWSVQIVIHIACVKNTTQSDSLVYDQYLQS